MGGAKLAPGATLHPCILQVDWLKAQQTRIDKSHLDVESIGSDNPSLLLLSESVLTCLALQNVQRNCSVNVTTVVSCSDSDQND